MSPERMSGFWDRIVDGVTRWRHLRGFGVHSPSAFLMMTEVVRPSRHYGLYSYHDLDCLLEQCSATGAELRRARQRMRMLLRLCCHLSPDSLRITTDNTTAPLAAKLLGELPRLSGVSTSVKTTPGLWIIATNTSHPDSPPQKQPDPSEPTLQENLTEALNKGSTIVLLDGATPLSESLYAAMPGGIRLDLRDAVILHPIPTSARASY